MPEFMDRYRTEAPCEQALVAARWPDGFVCPACSAGQACTTFRREGRSYWQCAGRQHQCSVISGTVFEATKLPLTVVSDGLGCFTVAAGLGAVHDREITGGGKASVLNEKFRAVNTAGQGR